MDKNNKFYEVTKLYLTGKYALIKLMVLFCCLSGQLSAQFFYSDAGRFDAGISSFDGISPDFNTLADNLIVDDNEMIASEVLTDENFAAIDIEGTWILDSAIVTLTTEDGRFAGASTYLLGDTLMTSEHPQPPQKVIITPETVSFEYSSPISYRTIIEYLRTGEYSFDGHTLKICFLFYEEYTCHRSDEGNLHLHYTCYLTDGVQRFKEHGVFKFRRRVEI
jgi:hypothetical protein